MSCIHLCSRNRFVATRHGSLGHAYYLHGAGTHGMAMNRFRAGPAPRARACDAGGGGGRSVSGRIDKKVAFFGPFFLCAKSRS